MRVICPRVFEPFFIALNDANLEHDGVTYVWT